MSCERHFDLQNDEICNRDLDFCCNIISESCSDECETENGAKSLSTTGDPRLDLFFKTVRNMPVEQFLTLLKKSWIVSSIDTIKTMFYIRDCRSGKGEKQLFLWFMSWLYHINYDIYCKLIYHIPHYGCWKDLRKLFEYNNNDNTIIKYWCSEILLDHVLFREGKPISLAAKWLPIQDSRFSKYFNMTHKQFRHFMKPLRENLNIVEQKMSSSKWDEIEFDKLPSIASKIYTNAFKKHCGERYEEFMKHVKQGSKKLNVNLIEPHDIISDILYNHQLSEEYLENAWSKLLEMNNNKSKSICVVDVSGSMYGLPITVAIALGLYCAQTNKDSIFYNKFITFSKTPELLEIKGNTLREQVESIHRANWCMNTNIQAVFDLILNNCKEKEQCPENIIILSDMQFDSIENNFLGKNLKNKENTTNYDEIQRKYDELGIKRPRLIFWNLRGDTPDFPLASNIPDCILVSGFSKNILSSVIETGTIDPMIYYRKIIDSDRYKRIVI
jgi:hypothetical protein